MRNEYVNNNISRIVCCCVFYAQIEVAVLGDYVLYVASVFAEYRSAGYFYL